MLAQQNQISSFHPVSTIGAMIADAVLILLTGVVGWGGGVGTQLVPTVALLSER